MNFIKNLFNGIIKALAGLKLTLLIKKFIPKFSNPEVNEIIDIVVGAVVGVAIYFFSAYIAEIILILAIWRICDYTFSLIQNIRKGRVVGE